MELEKELATLIMAGQIPARIDSHNKVLHARHADQRTRRIAVLGASTIFGYGVIDEQTWRVHAQQQLDRRLGKGQVELLNLAVAGYDLHKQLAYADHHAQLDIDGFIFAVDMSLLGAVECSTWWRTQSNAARIIAPGDPAHSVMLQRIIRPGPGRMPPIGAIAPDPQWIQLLAEWIAEQKRSK